MFVIVQISMKCMPNAANASSLCVPCTSKCIT